jgi:hypothetical protein
LLERVVAFSLAALVVAGPCEVTASPLDAKVSINVYSCLEDSNLAPVVRFRASPLGRKDNETAAPAQRKLIAPGLWHLAAVVPRGHWYIRVLTEHCAAFLTTTSVDGEERTFLTGTTPNNRGGFWDPKGYLAGSLPLPGELSTLWLSQDCSGSDNKAQIPAREGRYLYFDDLWPGDYCLIVISGGVDIVRHVHVPLEGTTVRITTEEIKAAFEEHERPNPSPSHRP